MLGGGRGIRGSLGEEASGKDGVRIVQIVALRVSWVRVSPPPASDRGGGEKKRESRDFREKFRKWHNVTTLMTRAMSSESLGAKPPPSPPARHQRVLGEATCSYSGLGQRAVTRLHCR